MIFSLEQIEFFFCIVVRISAFMYSAPIFSLKNVPVRVKIFFSIAISFLVFEAVEFTRMPNGSVIDFALYVGKEALAGLILGYFANVGYYILSFAGHMMDMEIGFSMVNEFDPVMNTQVTITANLYSYAVMLMLIITNMHHFIIKAIVDSFYVLPIGNFKIPPDMMQVMIDFVVDYFMIGFRIILPMFSVILIINIVLAILAKVAPQMNMFVIGLQLKVLVGLIVLIFMITLLPSVTDFIFNEMMNMIKNAVVYMKP